MPPFYHAEEAGITSSLELTLGELRRCFRGLKEDKDMYLTLKNALDADPEATVVFVKGFDTLCRMFCDPSKCQHHQEIIDTDQTVADALGLEFDKHYRIADVINALEKERRENPRRYFAITRFSAREEDTDKWRHSVRKLCLRAIE